MEAESIARVCMQALEWAEAREYSGYNKFDALNSPILRWMAGTNWLLRGGFTYALSRSPINLRPLLLVEKRQNPSALGFFARSYLNLPVSMCEKLWMDKAVFLLERLLQLSQVKHFSAHCWGPEHPYQSTKFYREAYSPTTVNTVEVAEAFLDAYIRTHDVAYLAVAQSAAEFLERELTTIINSDHELCYSYVPDNSLKVVNVNALISAFLARLASLIHDDKMMSRAHRIMKWVINRQTDYGLWYYADPPQASHVKHDNYHTGYILDSLHYFLLCTRDDAFANRYIRGLESYNKLLFLENGAPKWRSDQTYPLDIYGAAQGILTFTLASDMYPEYLDVAIRIACWMFTNMWSPEGRFFYQKDRFWKKRYTLMRWCQARASYALSELVLRLE